MKHFGVLLCEFRLVIEIDRRRDRLGIDRHGIAWLADLEFEMSVLVTANVDARGRCVRGSRFNRSVRGNAKFNEVMRLERPDVSVLPASNPAPAIVIITRSKAVEVGLGIELDGCEKQASLGMIDIHANVARLPQVGPEIAIVAVVALSHVKGGRVMFDPGEHLVGTDAKRSVLNGQPGSLAGHALAVAFAWIADRDQIKHIADGIEPDSEPLTTQGS